MTSVNIETFFGYLNIQKKVYGLKISQSIVYVKEYSMWFSLPWKIYKQKIKQIIELAKTLSLFV